ncbi:MAG: VOC family protein [Phycisphaerae bacterium]
MWITFSIGPVELKRRKTMSSKANAIPEGFRTVTPHMTVKDAAAAIEFYKKAFGAEELFRMPGPGGKGVMHAEIKIGDSVIMLNDEFPGCGPMAPTSLKGTSVTVHLYVEDADKVFNRAVDAGATPAMPVTDMFWGDRYGGVTDPFGHRWSVATHTEDVSPEECAQRAETFFATMGDACEQK